MNPEQDFHLTAIENAAEMIRRGDDPLKQAGIILSESSLLLSSISTSKRQRGNHDDRGERRSDEATNDERIIALRLEIEGLGVLMEENIKLRRDLRIRYEPDLEKKSALMDELNGLLVEKHQQSQEQSR